MKRLYLLAFIIIFAGSTTFAQTKHKAQDIYNYTKSIAKMSDNQIWEGFDPLKFIVFKKSQGKNHIYFSSEPNKPNSRIFMTLSDEYFQKHSLEGNLTITFHEAFHAFQGSPNRTGMRWRRENNFYLFEYQETSARNNMLFNIESKILLSALRTKDIARLKEKVGQFLAIRKLRQNEMKSYFIEFEKGAELNEGLAEYVGTKAVVLAMKFVKQNKLDLPFNNSESNKFLLKKYEKLDSITKIGSNIRLKFYYTGSAQAFLLDRLLPNWKQEVQTKGASLQDLLKRSLSPTKDKKLTNSILRKYQNNKILKDEEKSVAKRKADNQILLEKTLTQEGTKVSIDFSKLSNDGQLRQFDPMNVTMITPKLRVHTRMVKVSGGKFFSADFLQPVVEDLLNRKYTTVIPKGKDFKILVDGKTLELRKVSQIKFDRKIEISSEKFKFKAIKGEISLKGNEILIKLAES